MAKIKNKVSAGKKVLTSPTKTKKTTKTQKTKTQKIKTTKETQRKKTEVKKKPTVRGNKPGLSSKKPVKPTSKHKKAPALTPNKAKKVSAKKTSDKSSQTETLIMKHLIQKRDEIINEARNEIKKYAKEDARQIVESALDDGDLSVIDLSEDINLKRLGAHRENLIKIDAALIKIKEGTYGICEECGEDISIARLKVMPFAIYCRDCQEKKEELEKIEAKEEL